MWLILSGDWKVVKMGRFWPKSKAIHLVFWPIFNLQNSMNDCVFWKSAHFHHFSISTQNQSHWDWKVVKKWADFDQKVRLYSLTWYFGRKFNVTDFESAHFHHFSISKNQSHWILSCTKCIALLFGQNLILTKTQNQYIEFWSWSKYKCIAYFLVKICPFSPLFIFTKFNV